MAGLTKITGSQGTLTDFTSTGIDDNADANALTIDSSENLQFNSGYGSVATAYGCRAWVRFTGSGTVSIYGSGNISSITDNGTGQYTLNFTTAMPDVNYSAVGSNDGLLPGQNFVTYFSGSPAVGSIQCRGYGSSGNLYDLANFYIAIFR